MVTDVLANARLYAGLGSRIARGLEFLSRTDLTSLAAGKYELDGAALYATVNDYTTKPEAEGRWETHRRYIDLQYVAIGAERIGVAFAGDMSPADYDEQKDITRPTGRGDFVTVPAGHFMILWPHDAHMPGIQAAASPSAVRKVVVKIAVEQ